MVVRGLWAEGAESEKSWECEGRSGEERKAALSRPYKE